jgi:hypothetical protein
VLSNKIISENEIKQLTDPEKIVLFIYMNKRCLISDSSLNSIGNILSNTNQIMTILKERSDVSNCNESGLTETIINRILRYCFEDWIKEVKINIFNGKYKYKNKYMTNEDINKMFWYKMIMGGSTSPEKNNKFEKFYLKISKNIQIKKKRISKKKRIKSISIKKPKYLNIFLKKKLKEKILRCAKNNKCFRSHYDSYISHVFGQYQINEGYFLSANVPTEDSKNPKFSFKLKEEIKKAVLQMLKWFRNNGKNLKCVNAKQLKVRLKHIACPVTLKDYQNIFESINNICKTD